MLQILDLKGYDTSRFYNIGGWAHFEEKDNYVKKTGPGKNLLDGLPALESLTLKGEASGSKPAPAPVQAPADDED